MELKTIRPASTLPLPPGEIACSEDCELDVSACEACLEPLALCEDDDACCSEDCSDLGVCG